MGYTPGIAKTLRANTASWTTCSPLESICSHASRGPSGPPGWPLIGSTCDLTRAASFAKFVRVPSRLDVEAQGFAMDRIFNKLGQKAVKEKPIGWVQDRPRERSQGLHGQNIAEIYEAIIMPIESMHSSHTSLNGATA